MIENNTHLLRYEGIPKEIQELDDLRKQIKDFKDEEAIRILERYYCSWEYLSEKKEETFWRFTPKLEPTPENRNVGVFATAVCLRIISFYNKEINKSRDIKVKDFSKKLDINKEQTSKFIIKALAGEFPPENKRGPYSGTIPGLMPIINTLSQFKEYMGNNSIEKYITASDINILNKICLENTLEYYSQLSRKQESLHPYLLYKFLQFLKLWRNKIEEVVITPQDIIENLEKQHRDQRCPVKSLRMQAKFDCVNYVGLSAERQNLLEHYRDCGLRFVF